MRAVNQAVAPPVRPAAWLRRAMPLLGTLVEIAVPARDDVQLRHWTGPAFERVAAFHAAMSFHEDGSDLAAIARCHGGERLRVSPDTWATLQLALDLEAASEGLFNVAVGATLAARGVLPTPRAAATPLATSARAALRLLPDAGIEVLEPVWIDLGGIAKGMAVDAAIAALQAAGAPAGLVNAGGDLRAFGPDEHVVHLRDPRNAAASIAVARLADGAFATSSPQFGHKLVTPHGHVPWHDEPNLSISVAASTCALADALTKVVALLGPAARALLASHDAHALWLAGDGRVRHV